MLSDISQAVRAGIVRDEYISSVSLQQKRLEWEAAVSSLPLPAEITLQYEQIAARKCLWVRKSGSSDDAMIAYVHGGGMVEGSVVTHQEFASRLSIACNMDVLLIDYSLSPECIYPAARLDVESVLIAIQDCPVAPKVVYLGGESSGAGLLLSALVSLKAKDYAMAPRMFLISGVYDLTFSGRSIDSLANTDPFTSIDVLCRYAEFYAPKLDKKNADLSPLFADLSKLPEALILVGSDEILLSDSQRLSKALLHHDVNNCLEVWPDMWHAWPMYPELPEAESTLLRVAEYLSA